MPTPTNVPARRIPAWEESTLHERFRDCVRLLHIHGLITDGECRAIGNRVLVAERREQGEGS